MSVPSPAPPVRTCVGCRQRAAKADLLRVVVDDRGAGREVVPDPKGRAPGRGAHLHPTLECLELAERKRAFARALRQGGRALSLEQLREHLTPSVTDQPR